MSEPEFDHEMAEALENAEAAEVVCIILPLINQCLVYDSRSARDDPPRISVSPPLGSGERRLRHVNKARPHLERSRSLAVIPWPGSVGSLAESGVWRMLVTRMADSGSAEMDARCVEALEELRQWERRSMMSLIRGQGPYHTLWSRTDK